MPFLLSECVASASSTICSYTQVAPFAVVDWPLVAGLSIVIALMAAQFVRYVFYR